LNDELARMIIEWVESTKAFTVLNLPAFAHDIIVFVIVSRSILLLVTVLMIISFYKLLRRSMKSEEGSGLELPLVTLLLGTGITYLILIYDLTKAILAPKLYILEMVLR